MIAERSLPFIELFSEYTALQIQDRRLFIYGVFVPFRGGLGGLPKFWPANPSASW